jgi:hypothetical protein
LALSEEISDDDPFRLTDDVADGAAAEDRPKLVLDGCYPPVAGAVAEVLELLPERFEGDGIIDAADEAPAECSIGQEWRDLAQASIFSSVSA